MKVFLFLLSLGVSGVAYSQNLTIYRSDFSVEKTVERLVNVMEADEKLIYFETVSHDLIAKERGLDLAPIKSILFEEPLLTTALIQCQPTSALDLPLEIIVWKELGDVYVGFIDPKYMVRRFLILDCEETIQALSNIMIRTCVKSLKSDH